MSQKPLNTRRQSKCRDTTGPVVLVNTVNLDRVRSQPETCAVLRKMLHKQEARAIVVGLMSCIGFLGLLLPEESLGDSRF